MLREKSTTNTLCVEKDRQFACGNGHWRGFSLWIIGKCWKWKDVKLDSCITVYEWVCFVKQTVNWSSCRTFEGVQVCHLCAPRCQHHQVQFLHSPRLSCKCAHEYTDAEVMWCFSFSVVHKLHRNILVHKCYRKTDATFIWILRPFKRRGKKEKLRLQKGWWVLDEKIYFINNTADRPVELKKGWNFVFPSLLWSEQSLLLCAKGDGHDFICGQPPPRVPSCCVY